MEVRCGSKGRYFCPFWLGKGGGDNVLHVVRVARRKIRLIECNAKCRYLKKLICKGSLRQVF